MLRIVICAVGLLVITALSWQETHNKPGTTTLTNPAIQYELLSQGQARVIRADIEALLVDNRAVGGVHRAGYNGIAELFHSARRENLFVPFESREQILELVTSVQRAWADS